MMPKKCQIKLKPNDQQIEGVSTEQLLYLKVNAKTLGNVPDWQECLKMCIPLDKKVKVLLSRNKEWRQPNIGQTSNDARND